MDDITRSRARWRRAFVVLLVVWLLTAGGSLYALMDQGVSLTYQSEGYRALEQDLSVLSNLAPTLAKDITREQVLSTLRRQHPAALIVATDSSVGIGGLEFRFGAEGRLQTVVHDVVDTDTR